MLEVEAEALHQALGEVLLRRLRERALGLDRLAAPGLVLQHARQEFRQEGAVIGEHAVDRRPRARRARTGPSALRRGCSRASPPWPRPPGAPGSALPTAAGRPRRSPPWAVPRATPPRRRCQPCSSPRPGRNRAPSHGCSCAASRRGWRAATGSRPAASASAWSSRSPVSASVRISWHDHAQGRQLLGSAPGGRRPASSVAMSQCSMPEASCRADRRRKRCSSLP